MPFPQDPLERDDDVAARVLVVDDNVPLAENISEILELNGYLTAIAETAEQAFDRMASGDIGLLITDCRLPGASGLELIAMIARSTGKIPAIVMSGFLDDAMREVANHLGAVAILPARSRGPPILRLARRRARRASFAEGRPSRAAGVVPTRRVSSSLTSVAARGDHAWPPWISGPRPKKM